MNIQGATDYANSLTYRMAREYAHALIGYYRYYGTPQHIHWPWPTRYETRLATATGFKVSNTVRHYMVGDCDLKGRLLK